jgi:hypothetical protein
MAQPAIAAAMGVSLSTVNRAHMAYDDGGINRSQSSIWTYKDGRRYRLHQPDCGSPIYGSGAPPGFNQNPFATKAHN